MRTSKSLARIRQGEIARVCQLGHYIPGFVRHAARKGYDCLWIDLEHRAMQDYQVQSLMAHARLYDLDVLLRPPTLEKTGMCRFLEDGATGLIIPHVSTEAMAREIVWKTKFPPVGERGLDNAGLDADFRDHDPDDYVAWTHRETFLAVIIETPEGVHNAEAIAAVEGIDMLFIGPGDLGLRLRQSGEMSLEEAWKQVASACERQGKVLAGPVSGPEDLSVRKMQGARFLVHGNDYDAWTHGLDQAARLWES